MRATFIILFSLLLSFSPLIAQEEEIPSELKTQFLKAKDHLKAFQNDSANLVLTQLIAELKLLDQLNSTFGLRVQLREAEALEKDHQNELAVKKLFYVVEQGEQYQQWDVLANAHLSLARLHEKMGRVNKCLSHLDSARLIINKEQLGELYPRFCIRLSSYHRLFSNPDSSLFYANEVIRTAPLHGLYEEEATGHLLLGLLTGKSDYEAAINHYKQAGKVWRKIGDYSGYCMSLLNIAKLHFKNDHKKEALLYTDSSLVAAVKSIALGHDQPWAFYANYKLRADVYWDLGQVDSAWIYLRKGHQMELNEVYKSNIDKVIEIDAKYNDEKKLQQIEAQALQIKNEANRRLLLIIIIGIIILFAAMLSYYLFKLRATNKKANEQALEISRTNEELSTSLQQQIILQGELHHRVKNNLQVINSLLDLQLERVEDPEAVKSLNSMSSRIYSMAAIHEILYIEGGKEHVSLLDYIDHLCNHFSNLSGHADAPYFDIKLNNQDFNMETLSPLGIILTELLTNSLKYAKVEGKSLRIAIKLDNTPEGFCLLYKDNGPGFPKGKLEERTGGLGAYLLNRMCRQLSGSIETANENGAVCTVYFTAKNPIS